MTQAAHDEFIPRFVIAPPAPAPGERQLQYGAFHPSPAIKNPCQSSGVKLLRLFTARLLLHGTTLISSWQGHSNAPLTRANVPVIPEALRSGPPIRCA